jgi:hypothetical protein
VLYPFPYKRLLVQPGWPPSYSTPKILTIERRVASHFVQSTLKYAMSNTEAGTAEKGIPVLSNEDATFDCRDPALCTEDVSMSFPPDGGYGWTVVVAILFLNAVTWGTTVRPLRPTTTDLGQASTHRSESTYLISRHSRPLQVLHRSCTRSSEAFRSLSPCYALPSQTF